MAKIDTKMSCPMWYIIDTVCTVTDSTIMNTLFHSEDDSQQIQHNEEKSPIGKTTTNQSKISCPNGFSIDQVDAVTVKGINKSFFNIENILQQIQNYMEKLERIICYVVKSFSYVCDILVIKTIAFICLIILQQIQNYVENLKRIICYVVNYFSYICEIFVIKTFDFIYLIIYVGNNNDHFDTNSINSTIIYTTIDNNRRNNINNDYDNNCDNNNIDNNYDIYDANNYKLYGSNSKIGNSTQSNSTDFSNESEFVENISENITPVSETPDITINNFDQPSTENIIAVPSSTNEYHLLLPIIQFKSLISKVNNQEDIDDELCLPFSYQYMFDKRTSPWEMKDWEHEDLNNFAIQPEKIDRLYHMVADDEDQNFRSWEICCRMDYKGEKHFVEMYANCDYTGFDCQGGGHISITKLPDFFLENMVTMDQNPDLIYTSLREDGYNVQEPDLLHKVHPKFWNNAPMLKYLCHNAIYKHRDVLPHFKDELPSILANSVDDFIKVKDWDNE